MKNKFRLWLNIVTICLCVCAIAIGVYSATTANLNVGGKIAFSAHNCKVDITAYIYGHAEGNDDDGLPVAEAQKEPLNGGNALSIEGGVSTTEQCKLDLGTRYFTDMASTDGSAEDIVIGITVKNTSAYKITAKTGTHTLPTRVTASANQDTADIDPQGTTTFVFTLELQPDTEGGTVYSSITTLQDLVLALEFEKWEEIELLKWDETNNYYYIELGTNPDVKDQSGNNVPLRWIPYAESTDGTTFSISDSASEPKAGNTYYFISEYVLSAVGGGTAMANYGLSYCNDYYNSSTNNFAHNTYQSGSVYISAHNYATSNLRAYFKSTSSNQVSQYYKANSSDSNKYEPDTSVQINFLDRFGISSDYLYQNKEKYGITARSLSELYTTDKNSVDYATFENTFKTSNPELFTDDYFWAPSLAELTYVNGVEDTTVASGTTYANLIAYQSYDGGNTAAHWWSRSPYASNGNGAYGVRTSGNVHISNVNLALGARPAFQITIPA